MAIILQRPSTPLGYASDIAGRSIAAYTAGMQAHDKEKEQKDSAEMLKQYRGYQLDALKTGREADLAGSTALSAIGAGMASTVYTVDTGDSGRAPTVTLNPMLQKYLADMSPAIRTQIADQLELHNTNIQNAWYQEQMPQSLEALARIAGPDSEYPNLQIAYGDGPAVGMADALNVAQAKSEGDPGDLHDEIENITARFQSERTFMVRKEGYLAHVGSFIKDIAVNGNPTWPGNGNRQLPEGYGDSELKDYLIDMQGEALYGALSSGDAGKPGYWEAKTAELKIATGSQELSPREIVAHQNKMQADREKEVVASMAEAFGVPAPASGLYEDLDKDLQDKGLLPTAKGNQAGSWSISDITHAIQNAQTPEAAAELQSVLDEAIDPLVLTSLWDDDDPRLNEYRRSGDEPGMAKSRKMTSDLLRAGLVETEELWDLLGKKVYELKSERELAAFRARDARIGVTRGVAEETTEYDDPGMDMVGGRSIKAIPSDRSKPKTKMVQTKDGMKRVPVPLATAEPERHEGFHDDDPNLRPGLTADSARRMLDREGVPNSMTAEATAQERLLEEQAGGPEARAKQIKAESVKIKAFLSAQTPKTYATKLAGLKDSPENSSLTEAQYRSKVANAERTVRRIKSKWLHATKRGFDSTLTSDITAHHDAMELMRKVGSL